MKRRKSINKIGKKTDLWIRVRAELKKEFEANGIVRCEVCGTDFGLSFAHRMRRRFITDEQELKAVALLCVPHHEEIDRAGNETMFRRINEIIESREQVFV